MGEAKQFFYYSSSLGIHIPSQKVRLVSGLTITEILRLSMDVYTGVGIFAILAKKFCLP